jgi:hypothetical protein
MENELFDRPVPIFVGMGYLTQVNDVPHAYALLSDWPTHWRCPAHAMALKACRAAMVGELDAETVRILFETFARRKDILAPYTSALVAAKSPRSERHSLL